MEHQHAKVCGSSLYSWLKQQKSSANGGRPSLARASSRGPSRCAWPERAYHSYESSGGCEAAATQCGETCSGGRMPVETAGLERR